MRDRDGMLAFDALLRPHFDALYRTALRISRHPSAAEDLVQEACLRAHRDFASGRKPENFRPWIFRIMINLSIDQSRRAASDPMPLASGQEIDELPTSEKSAAEIFANDRLRRDLVAAVQALPVDLRVLVQLVLVEGMTYQEAAECIDRPIGTVRSRVNRARGLLQDHLAEHAPEGGANSSRDSTVVKFPVRTEQSR